MGEPRIRTRRTWIKLYCYGRLHGSVVYQLSEAEQSVWDKLLCLAGLCGREGHICDNDGRPYPHSHIAHEIHTTEELLEVTIVKCKDEGRINENAQGLYITNWAAYQSEYDRQKPYRQKDEIIYRDDGEIDEEQTIICCQSLYKIRQILKGEISATERNKKRYRHELIRLNLSFDEAKI